MAPWSNIYCDCLISVMIIQGFISGLFESIHKVWCALYSLHASCLVHIVHVYSHHLKGQLPLYEFLGLSLAVVQHGSTVVAACRLFVSLVSLPEPHRDTGIRVDDDQLSLQLLHLIRRETRQQAVYVRVLTHCALRARESNFPPRHYFKQSSSKY